MPVRVFKEEEKKQIREKLLEVGFPILKEYGMLHMSIPKISSAAGIGTGTFYHFFKSKEEYVYQLIVDRRKRFFDEIITDDVKEGKRKLSKEEVRRFIEIIVDKEKSVYANLQLSEAEILFTYIKSFSPDIQREKVLAEPIIDMIDNPRKDINFPVVANLMKVLGITAEARDELHEEGYEETIRVLVDSIMNELFE